MIRGHLNGLFEFLFGSFKSSQDSGMSPFPRFHFPIPACCITFSPESSQTKSRTPSRTDVAFAPVCRGNYQDAAFPSARACDSLLKRSRRAELKMSSLGRGDTDS